MGAAARSLRAPSLVRVPTNTGCAQHNHLATIERLRTVSRQSSTRFLSSLLQGSGQRNINAAYMSGAFPRSSDMFRSYERYLHATQVNAAGEPLNVPEMGESISEGTIVGFLKDAGEEVDEDDIIAQIETDKITVDVRTPKAGVVTDILAKDGDVVKVGQPIANIDYSKEAIASTRASKGASSDQKDESSNKVKSDPMHSGHSQGKGNDLDQGGVEREAKGRKDEVTGMASSTESKSTRTKFGNDDSRKVPIKVEPVLNRSETGERRIAMTRMRKRIAERLKEAQNTAAMLTTFNEMDMSALMDLRHEYKDAFEKKHGAKLGFMSAFVKACTVALLEQPEVNAFIDGSDIVYRDYVDISVAVSTPKGLVVPAIRGCENLNFASIEKTIVSLGDRARKGEITIEEMQGGTFTISNGGVFGSLLSTPIINMPQSAILGMHIIQKRPVVVNDQVTIRPMMYVALSYDHRLIDGREAVTFLRRVKTLIEDPRRLLLEIDI